MNGVGTSKKREEKGEMKTELRNEEGVVEGESSGTLVCERWWALRWGDRRKMMMRLVEVVVVVETRKEEEWRSVKKEDE